MALETITTAPELTREQVSTMLVTPLEQQSVFLSSGPTIFDTDGNAVRVPKINATDLTALPWTGENGEIPETEPDFDEVTLLPSTMKSVKTLTRFSNELARQSIVSLESALRARLVSDVAAKIDAHLLSDDGDGTTTPLGLFKWADTTKITATALDVDVILDAYGAALAAGVGNPGAMTLFMNPADYMTVRKIKDGDGRYLLAPDTSSTGVTVPMIGATAKISAHVPAGKAALVDMSSVAVARDVNPSVTVLRERYGDYDQQAIRTVTRLDAAPLRPAAVVTINVTGAAGKAA